MHHVRSSCRVCGNQQLKRFLSLGPTPLANSFLSSPDQFADELSFPLDVYFCEDCTLVQLLDVIDPEVLFRNYIYVTGTSDTIARHNAGYASRVTELLKMSPDDLVVEVASNDGSLLREFQKHSVRTLGVEPARNIARMAEESGVETVNDFFCLGTAQQVHQSHGPARAVIGNNVLAHVDDTREFIQGCRHLISECGLVIVEVPYLGELVNRIEYDTIYHEHLCYFSVSSLLRLCESAGLSVVLMEHVPVHGGSLRMYAGAKERYPEHAADVVAWAEREREEGLASLTTFERLAARVAENRRALLELLEKLRSEGKTVAAYGAPAKGNTLLNYCGIGQQLVSFTVDKNPMKVGLYTPGMHLPVLPVSALVEKRPDYVLILAWNFADEIMRQQAQYRELGGRFIIPIPQPEVV
jgi:hypothetical protein